MGKLACGYSVIHFIIEKIIYCLVVLFRRKNLSGSSSSSVWSFHYNTLEESSIQMKKETDLMKKEKFTADACIPSIHEDANAFILAFSFRYLRTENVEKEECIEKVEKDAENNEEIRLRKKQRKKEKKK